MVSINCILIVTFGKYTIVDRIWQNIDILLNLKSMVLLYFKHILLFNKKQLDRTQVSQLRNVFSNTYMN